LQPALLQRHNVLSPVINLHEYPYAIIRWGDLTNRVEAWLVKDEHTYDRIPVPRQVQSAKRFTCLTGKNSPYEIDDKEAKGMAEFINSLISQHQVRGVMLYALTLCASNLTWAMRTKRNSFSRHLKVPADTWLASCEEANLLLKGGLELVYTM
jgi:hypothetical protein